MTGSHGYKKILGPEDDRSLSRNVWVPDNARAYIRFVEDAIEAPIDIISTGPDRMETIVLRHSLDM